MLCAFGMIPQNLENSHFLRLLSFVKSLAKLLSKYFSFSARNHTLLSNICHFIKLFKALTGHGLVEDIEVSAKLSTR